jgi:hypothetical protein
MALVTPSSRSATDATRTPERSHVSRPVPLKQPVDAPVANGREGTSREHVRMELLVARARAARI